MGLFSKLFGLKTKNTSDTSKETHSMKTKSQNLDEYSDQTSLSESDKFWIQVIEGRTKAMPMNMLGVMFNSAEDLGMQHCEEYQSRDEDLSVEERSETALNRLNMLRNIKEYIETNGTEAQKFHYEASVIGARKYVESIRVHWDDTEDIGIVTHVNGKPFTGVVFRQSRFGAIWEETDFVDGLKHGKLKLVDSDRNVLFVTECINDEIIFTETASESKYEAVLLMGSLYNP